ncbi:hypothetical protein [Arachidicoccus soli]|uniref:Uncharacterized protein n=1 Tax=Arachidicoccus soli TaxID=2341117 RepID=A0A386HP37_9BACT|nr:hypothetical protein [Arachidicoccus soli]AYD47409.1 hypothetical protein D6B99_07170 [Arachidicoccus soli]
MNAKTLKHLESCEIPGKPDGQTITVALVDSSQNARFIISFTGDKAEDVNLDPRTPYKVFNVGKNIATKVLNGCIYELNVSYK